jgi:DNA repair exonuclease SbcCD nuclease subunit
MIEFTIITANDIHIGDINPRSRVDDFKETILEKIEQIRKECDKRKADAFIIAGDLFNLKNPNKNTHGLVRELIELFKKFKCPVYMIPGNHDMTGNNLESLKDQPLGVLFASGAVINLTDEKLGKKSHKGDPSPKVSIVGIPYIDDIDLSSISLPPKEDCIAQICALHLYAGPQAGSVFKEKLYGYDELSSLGSDVFVIGHYHIDQGIQILNGKHFINIGSITRGSLAEENLSHQPKMGVIKIQWEEGKTTIKTETQELKVKPASEIFDLVKREKEKKEITEIQKFVDQLIIGTSSSIERENMETLINKLGVATAVKEKTLFYIHEAANK